MATQIFANLPVKKLRRSVEFCSFTWSRTTQVNPRAIHALLISGGVASSASSASPT
jgi:hypothetical protein